jgi:ABC-type lipoprotein export system ATPase subunit
MLDEGPSKLYDALSGILGLDELVQAQTVLQKARAPRESRAKEAQDTRKRLEAQLAASDDPRARDAKRLLAAGQPFSLPPDSGPPLTLPDVAPVIDELRRAASLADAAAGTLAGRSHELACLLDQALAFHQTHGGDCPVCGAPLGPDWRSDRLAQLTTLRNDARTAAEGRAAVERALARARALVLPDLEEARGFLLDTDDPRALADHLEAAFVPLREAVLRLRQTDAERDERWRPLAAALAAYVPPDRESVSLLKKAEAWLKDASDAVRAERFRPVADHARALWEKLRHESNVSLDSITLGGTGKGRRVDLAVTVDGCAGAALGVMSQGEQNALALSVFIPRATLPESPFRFLVIDDPVQSMDPARVDGLARVLHQTSRDRQVIVFTHDDRLPEALRRLALPATVLEVCRGAGSVVSVRPVRDPASRALDDARALVLSTNLPPEAVRRVVPKQPTKALVALTHFDDPETKDVMSRLNKQSRAFADVCRYAVEGAHEPRTDLVLDRVRDAEKLVHWLRAQS